MPSDLPPGCSVSDIPGNRPEDIAWEEVHKIIDDDASKHAMSDMDVYEAWKLGLAVYVEARKNKVRFQHDGED